MLNRNFKCTYNLIKHNNILYPSTIKKYVTIAPFAPYQALLKILLKSSKINVKYLLKKKMHKILHRAFYYFYGSVVFFIVQRKYRTV